MKKFWQNNSLSIVFLFLFAIAFIGQIYNGYKEHNKELEEKKRSEVTIGAYLVSGHFLQATFENWESEFLQMALFVVLTVSLVQKGSSESKKPGEEKKELKQTVKTKDAPWPVQKGGVVLKLYEHSLSIVFTLLFLISFLLHLFGSMKDENEQLALKGLPAENMLEHMVSARFWFESFQNWQSEFLSVFAIVVLSIYLREKGSPQSKPVNASNEKTGE